MNLLRITTVCLLILVIATKANAQKNDSYLLLNYNFKPQSPYYIPYIGYAPRHFANRNSINLGLQWIRNNSNESAWRFGFSIHEDHLYTQGTSKQIVDTTYINYSGYDIILPKLSVGKEWQKHIHKDVTMYAGADLGFGLMKNGKMNVEERHVHSANNMYNYSSYSANQSGSKLAMNISARPFAGLRMNFNRFTIGYEAGLPRNYTRVLGENLYKWDKPTIQHQLSMGFKLGKMRTKK